MRACKTCRGRGVYRILGRPAQFCACAAGSLARVDAERLYAAATLPQDAPARDGGPDGTPQA